MEQLNINDIQRITKELKAAQNTSPRDEDGKMIGEGGDLYTTAKLLIEENFSGVDGKAAGTERDQMEALNVLAELVHSETGYHNRLAGIAAGDDTNGMYE